MKLNVKDKTVNFLQLAGAEAGERRTAGRHFEQFVQFSVRLLAGAVSGVPDWVRQSTQTYELLADWLDKDVLMDRISDKSLKAFRQVMGKEPSWRKKNAAKCDLTYAVLRACWDVC